MRDCTIDIAALRRILDDQEMSVAELARRSGVSRSLIKYVLAGTCQFSRRTAGPVARALKCRIGDFTTRIRGPWRNVA